MPWIHEIKKFYSWRSDVYTRTYPLRQLGSIPHLFEDRCTGYVMEQIKKKAEIKQQQNRVTGNTRV